jgi:hypothetical protein
MEIEEACQELDRSGARVVVQRDETNPADRKLPFATDPHCLRAR